MKWLSRKTLCGPRGIRVLNEMRSLVIARSIFRFLITNCISTDGRPMFNMKPGCQSPMWPLPMGMNKLSAVGRLLGRSVAHLPKGQKRQWQTVLRVGDYICRCDGRVVVILLLSRPIARNRFFCGRHLNDLLQQQLLACPALALGLQLMRDADDVNSVPINVCALRFDSASPKPI